MTISILFHMYMYMYTSAYADLETDVNVLISWVTH